MFKPLQLFLSTLDTFCYNYDNDEEGGSNLSIDKKKLGSRIKEIRVNEKDTLEAFANKINKYSGGVIKSGKSNVSRWEKGENIPNDITLKAIADIGDMTVEELLYGNTDKIKSVDDELYEQIEKFIARKNGVLQEVKLLAPSALSGLTFGLAFREMSENAVKDNEALKIRIKDLEMFGYDYIKRNYDNYTYEKFRQDFPDSTLHDFEHYKEKKRAIFVEILENYWRYLDENYSNYSLINSRFTNQISDELNKISRIALKEDKEEYYVEEVIQPFLDRAAKDFKEYIKDYIDTED